MSDLLGALGGDGIGSYILIISVFAPGFIINYFRNAFITGRAKSLSEEVLKLVIISSVYYSAVIPILFWIGNFSGATIFLVLFFIPLLIGVILGVMQKSGLNETITRFLRINPVHPAPTAWDFLFGAMKGNHWLIITLNDDRKIFGYFGQKSLASSDLKNLDIYLEMLTDKDFNNFQNDGRKRGIWVDGTLISFIEAISEDEYGENSDEKEEHDDEENKPTSNSAK